MKKSTFQDIFACISAVWLSVYSKIHESCKREVKPRIKVVIVQQSAAKFTMFTSRASQFCSRPFLNRCGFAVYTTSKPYCFENAPLLKAYSKRHGSDNELDRCRVNERCNRIETDAVTNRNRVRVNSALASLYQKCLILGRKILPNALHNMSLTVLLPWQHTGFQTFLATFGMPFL